VADRVEIVPRTANAIPVDIPGTLPRAIPVPPRVQVRIGHVEIRAAERSAPTPEPPAGFEAYGAARRYERRRWY
jgi:hypothetical protein